MRFEGVPFVGASAQCMYVNPRSEGGIVFHSPAGVIPYDAEHLHAYRNRFSHMLALGNSPRLADIGVLVPEHLVSAMSLAGIYDADVVLENRIVSERVPLVMHGIFGRIPKDWKAATLPVMDTTSGDYYDRFSQVQTVDPATYKVTEPFEYWLTGMRGMEVTPSDTLEIIMQELPPAADRYHLRPLTFESGDVYAEATEHVHARGLARMPAVMRVFRRYLRFFQGPLGGYIRVSKDPEEVVRQMVPQYKLSRNEPFAHAVFSDIPAELLAFWPGKLEGRFVFYDFGGGHAGRLEMLRALNEEGLVRRKRKLNKAVHKPVLQGPVV
ncbi:MAG: hypothetical protein ACOCWQ_01235 [Nanoarchaeota archaeon]